MTQQAQVQLLDVAAVWDGEYDHFAWVKIAMEVSSTPNTVLPLLRWEDPLVDSVRLTEMMFLESMTPRHRRHSSDLSGETLADDDDEYETFCEVLHRSLTLTVTAR